MGFKADASFLKFVSMGAVGTQRAMQYLSALGFSPIELERYSASNKIWSTKVKRLRLPDLLCVRTGIRVEVRAKSELKIRMSDAPDNPERTWDAGLRDQDITAFIVCHEVSPGVTEPLGDPIFFTVGSLRNSVHMSKLGPPKSASEGAERDRTWASTVPKADGEVIEVTESKIVALLRKEGGNTRRQSYQLRGKTPYYTEGDQFLGNVTVLAGAPTEMAHIREYLPLQYSPTEEVNSDSPIDRYAAVKSFRYRDDLVNEARDTLLERIATETDQRVLLETAASGIALGVEEGCRCLKTYLYENERADLRMEAVLILTELANEFSNNELISIANNEAFQNDELRQAAVWGLGKAGVKAYGALIPFITDADPEVAIHAITAFDQDTPDEVIEHLISMLMGDDAKLASSASEVLRIIGSEAVVLKLLEIARNTTEPSPWLIATLGRIKGIESFLTTDEHLQQYLAPFQVLRGQENWLADEVFLDEVKFLLKQNIF